MCRGTTAWDSEIESLTSMNPSLIELDRHYCVQNIWATYGLHMGSPYAAHMQPICGPYVECFQKQPNCMWPICCLTYGNIWRKTNQHMGRASTYGKHIWAAYLIWSIPSKPLPSPAVAARLNSVKLPPSLC